jgi:hypothetical protein
MVSRQSTLLCGNKFSTSFLYRCGVRYDRSILIGPGILDDHMTGHNFLGFLQSGLSEQLGNIPLATWIGMYFQHDGAPSHYTRLVMQHLSDTS